MKINISHILRPIEKNVLFSHQGQSWTVQYPIEHLTSGRALPDAVLVCWSQFTKRASAKNRQPPWHAALPVGTVCATVWMQADGLVLLVQHLLEHCGLPPESCAHARELLAVDGLHALTVTHLQKRQVHPPLAFWRAKPGERGFDQIQLIVIDLNGAPADVSVALPAAVLSGEDTRTYAVRRHLASAGVTAHSALCARSTDDRALEVFSRRELMLGQLHVRVPSKGLVSFWISPATQLTDGRIEQTHLLSSLHRLARRPAEYARDNDVARTLTRICACRDDLAAGRDLLHLLDGLPTESHDTVGPLALTVSAAMHMAAAAGALEPPPHAHAANANDGMPLALPPRSLPSMALRPGLLEAMRRLVELGIRREAREAHGGGDGDDTGGTGEAEDEEGGERADAEAPPADGTALHAGLAPKTDNESPPPAARPGSVPAPRLLSESPGGSSAALPPSSSPTQLRSLFEALSGTCRRRRIAFITPEVGRWASVGGLGTMVGHLSTALAARGCDVRILAPAYDCYRGRWAHLPVERTLAVPIAHTLAHVAVRTVCEGGVTIHLLDGSGRFDKPYPTGDAHARLLQPVLLARASLCLLEALGRDRSPPPHAIITNDWVAALASPYARHAGWAGSATAAAIGALGRECLFIHLVHNLEPGYDGRLLLERGGSPSAIASLHQLPSHLLHEPAGEVLGGGGGSGGGGGGGGAWAGLRANGGVVASISLTRAALLCASAWATVSVAYREDLLDSSAYAPLLRVFGHGIACPSGLPLVRRRDELSTYGDHGAAKAALQRRCFGERGVAPAVPLLVFLGRVAYQKGVHLLLDCMPYLLQVNNASLAPPRPAPSRLCMARLAASPPRHRPPRSL